MAKSRMINTKIWEDAWFNDLDPIEKLFFVYLLTNPMTNILGVYELSKGTMGRATGLESRVVDEMLNRFEDCEKVYFRDGWVVISNFIKHQNYKSHKILAGLNAEMKNVPENIRNLIKSPIFLDGMDTISHSNSNLIQSNLIKEITPAQEAKALFEGKTVESFLEYFSSRSNAPPETLSRELVKFASYWTEKNKSGTKERWQQQNTFEVKRRFATWLANAKNFDKTISKGRGLA